MITGGKLTVSALERRRRRRAKPCRRLRDYAITVVCVDPTLDPTRPAQRDSNRIVTQYFLFGISSKLPGPYGEYKRAEHTHTTQFSLIPPPQNGGRTGEET